MLGRPTALFAQSIMSAGSAMGMALAILIGIGLLGFSLNWLILLLALPSGGVLSFGASMLIFGIAFPIGWLIAAQPYAISRGLQRLYRRNRDQVLSLIAAALQREVSEEGDPVPGRWLLAIDALRDHIDRLPSPIRPLFRLGLRRVGLEAIETALRVRSGPVPLRLAGAIGDRLEAELAGSASTFWLWVTVTANLLGYGLIFLVF